MPEEIQRMLDYSGAIGAFLSVSEIHFHNPENMGNGNLVDESLLLEEGHE